MKRDSQGNSVENRETAPVDSIQSVQHRTQLICPEQWRGHYELEAQRDFRDGRRQDMLTSIHRGTYIHMVTRLLIF